MPDDKCIALTFDDGPSDETLEILGCLEQHKATATFFVIGQYVEDRQETLRRAVAIGCEIGNHSFTHPLFTELDDAAVEQELRVCSDAIETAIGERPTLMRPPKGEYRPSTLTIAERLGLTTVMWTLHTADWSGCPSEEIVETVMAGVHPGCVVNNHDGTKPTDNSRRTNTVAAFREIIPRLLEEGYRLMTYSELLEASPAARTTLAA